MYYIEKEGVCGQGVMWIGEDKQEGLKFLDYLMSRSDDGYLLIRYICIGSPLSIGMTGKKTTNISSGFAKRRFN